MTIREIAKLSGVSVSTVSRYLNEGYVSEKNREVIARVIKETNFKRNSAAVNMRGKSNEVVIIVQRVSSATTSRFLDGIIRACRENGLVPSIIAVNFDLDMQNRVMEEAVSRKVFGIIVYSSTENLKPVHSNMIVVGQNVKSIPSIYSDGRKVIEELVTNVLTRVNCNNVKILGVEIMDIEFINRVHGATIACVLKDQEYTVYEQGFADISNEITIEKGDYFICMTDAQAYQVIGLANELDLVVGKDVFITGYGNYNTSKLLNLTTVDGKYEEIGNLAVKKLNDENFEGHCFTPSIKYRGSTGNN